MGQFGRGRGESHFQGRQSHMTAGDPFLNQGWAVQAWELNVATGIEQSPFSYRQTKDRISETPHSSL